MEGDLLRLISSGSTSRPRVRKEGTLSEPAWRTLTIAAARGECGGKGRREDGEWTAACGGEEGSSWTGPRAFTVRRALLLGGVGHGAGEQGRREVEGGHAQAVEVEPLFS